jgi:hypothetical protein
MLTVNRSIHQHIRLEEFQRVRLLNVEMERIASVSTGKEPVRITVACPDGCRQLG